MVATKSPWLGSGGGHLVVRAFVEALRDSGVAVRLVAPVDGAGGGNGHHPLVRAVRATPRPWLAVAPRALAGRSMVVGRWVLPRLEEAVGDEVRRFRPDLVHIEQVHLSWLIPGLERQLPVVLRQQNVESHILYQLARVVPAAFSLALRGEARALARIEAEACRRAHLVAAISEPDAADLRREAPEARVEVLPPIAPAVPGAGAAKLAGDPPFLCLGSFDWWPNCDGARWLVREVWPLVRRALPRAVLHLAGPGSSTIGLHARGVARLGPVAISGPLYDPSATVLIPVRAGSGVRMRLLEAWAAGVPVVTTPVGADGLACGDRGGALVGNGAAGFAELAVRLASDGGLRASLREAGRRRLGAFTPDLAVERARSLYQVAIDRFRAAT